MPVTCPRCRRSLSPADADGPPVFCMYCGQKLRDADVPPTWTAPPAEMRTTSFAPSPSDADDHPEPPPQQVGGYKLLRLLGAGGMGSVYEAESPGDGHRVAVKLLSARLSTSPGSVERFRQEGRLASQLSHPRCVFVLAADTDAGRPYIVMELMPGRTLRDVVDAEGPLPTPRAITYLLDVIDGLAEAHRLGVLHRDIKPSNCFLTADDRVKVGDFGLSKSLVGGGDHHLTQSGTFLGTVLFAAPEQIRGDPLDYEADVYAVCATLYYLLCGEAPYHHTSITAALARAITEPPPPLRAKRPEVSEALERIVMRGLERDRERRWRTLDELRDALADQLPGRQTPARPRMLVAAFLLDWLAITLVGMLPLEVVQAAVGWGHVVARGVAVDPIAWLLWGAYLGVCEGLWGRTLGKALLGLRVSRVGQTGPPGLGVGLARAGVFVGLWFWLFHGPAVAGILVSGVAGFGVLVLGLAGLLVQLRRSPAGYRGLHDFASGCHVTQRRLPTRRLRLVADRPSPVDAVQPNAGESLPAAVGGYSVRGRVWADPGREEVWAGDDRALARKVLLWVRPEGGGPPVPEVSRPTRVRRLGAGKFAWTGATHEWTAFAAPAGSPLADVVRPGRPLPWADARFLLEQLVEELEAAEKDGSTPARLTLGQVWVEPNGRVQLLDCPVSNESVRAPSVSEGVGVNPSVTLGARPDTSAALRLVREVATLTLEGRPRADGGPVHAPVPPHAAPILGRLFRPDGYSTLADLHCDLAETHAHTPEVTATVRAAQLGIQAAVLAAGLVLMFASSGVTAVVLAKLADDRAQQTAAALELLADPAARAGLDVPDPARAERRLVGLHERKAAEAEDRRDHLLRPQRYALEKFHAGAAAAEGSPRANAKAARKALAWAAGIGAVLQLLVAGGYMAMLQIRMLGTA
ncbi:MAG: protein kinase, partial [Gemmataceae bacterium]|nr:protein kinase [Gemmataceae bacterium]